MVKDEIWQLLALYYFLFFIIDIYIFFCTVAIWIETGTPRYALCFAMHAIIFFLSPFVSFFISILVHVLIYFVVTDKTLGQYATSRHLVESLSSGMAPGRRENRLRTPTAQRQEWRMYHSSRHVVPQHHRIGSSHHTQDFGGQVLFFSQPLLLDIFVLVIVPWLAKYSSVLMKRQENSMFVNLLWCTVCFLLSCYHVLSCFFTWLFSPPAFACLL